MNTQEVDMKRSSMLLARWFNSRQRLAADDNRHLACVLLAAALILLLKGATQAEQVSLESAPPVVVKTVPLAGAVDVDPALSEVAVTFSKPMADGNWSWSTWGEESVLEATGQPRYLGDGRTCVLPVKLQPGKFYATWLNSDEFHNFQDRTGRPAVPYLLTFVTAKAGGGSGAGGFGGGGGGVAVSGGAVGGFGGGGTDALLNAEQRLVLAWTDRQFGGFFDARQFNGWSAQDRADLEAKSLDALQGPHNREYYQAIGTLAALRSHKAGQPLLAIAADRADKDCRDRWMAIRALGIIGDKQVVPELIPLVYHGNMNTHWWAQISLVRLSGQNFGGDWEAWGKWWNGQNGQPPFKPELIRWWSGQPEPDKLVETLATNDRKFLQDIGSKPAPKQGSPESEAPSSSKQ
jgi:hypothetical protein